MAATKKMTQILLTLFSLFLIICFWPPGVPSHISIPLLSCLGFLQVMTASFQICSSSSFIYPTIEHYVFQLLTALLNNPQNNSCLAYSSVMKREAAVSPRYWQRSTRVMPWKAVIFNYQRIHYQRKRVTLKYHYMVSL